MKQKMTIGLLVFFLGILITACGSKKNNGDGGGGDGWYPNDGDFTSIRRPDNCNGSCSESLDATFHLEDKDEYANMFIGEIGSDPNGSYNGPRIDVRNADWVTTFAAIFLNNIANGVVHCGSAVLTGRILKDLFKAGDVEVQCDMVNDNRREYDNLRSSYGVTVQFEFDTRISGNGIESIILVVNRDNGRDTIEFDRRENDHLFYDRTGDYSLEIHSNTMDLISRNGQVGYITR